MCGQWCVSPGGCSGTRSRRVDGRLRSQPALWGSCFSGSRARMKPPAACLTDWHHTIDGRPPSPAVCYDILLVHSCLALSEHECNIFQSASSHLLPAHHGRTTRTTSRCSAQESIRLTVNDASVCFPLGLALLTLKPQLSSQPQPAPSFPELAQGWLSRARTLGNHSYACQQQHTTHSAVHTCQSTRLFQAFSAYFSGRGVSSPQQLTSSHHSQ